MSGEIKIGSGKLKNQNVMRVLLITWNYPPKVGGIENLLYKLVQSLSKRNIEIEVISPKKLYNRILLIRIVFFVFLFRSMILGTYKTLNNEYDLILTGNLLVSVVGIVIKYFQDISLVIMVHGTDLLYSNKLYQKLVRWILSSSDHVIANSTFIRDQAVQRGLDINNVTVINPGVDFYEYQNVPYIDIRKRLDILDEKIVLSIGRLTREKGLIDFLDKAYGEVINQYPNTILLIVGGNPDQALYNVGDIKKELQVIAKKEGLHSNIVFVGWVYEDEEIINYYRVCDVCILPAIGIEGFGKVIIEANAVGKPVVANNIGGISDAIHNGENGFLIEPGDWNNFSNKIISILKDEELREEMKVKAINLVREKFDWQIIAERYLKVFERIILE